MDTEGNGSSPLSVYLAFVVQFRTTAGAPIENVRGRVEHVASGRRANFGSWQEMQSFLERFLTQDGASGPEPLD